MEGVITGNARKGFIRNTQTALRTVRPTSGHVPLRQFARLAWPTVFDVAIKQLGTSRKDGRGVKKWALTVQRRAVRNRVGKLPATTHGPLPPRKFHAALVRQSDSSAHRPRVDVTADVARPGTHIIVHVLRGTRGHWNARARKESARGRRATRENGKILRRAKGKKIENGQTWLSCRPKTDKKPRCCYNLLYSWNGKVGLHASSGQSAA